MLELDNQWAFYLLFCTIFWCQSLGQDSPHLVKLDQERMACYFILLCTKGLKFLSEYPPYAWSRFAVNGRIRSSVSVLSTLLYNLLMPIIWSGFTTPGRIRSAKNGLLLDEFFYCVPKGLSFLLSAHHSVGQDSPSMVELDHQWVGSLLFRTIFWCQSLGQDSPQLVELDQ